MITIAILAGILIAGFILLAVELRNAPEAYQDETGFHHLENQTDRAYSDSQANGLPVMNASMSP